MHSTLIHALQQSLHSIINNSPQIKETIKEVSFSPKIDSLLPAISFTDFAIEKLDSMLFAKYQITFNLNLLSNKQLLSKLYQINEQLYSLLKTSILIKDHEIINITTSHISLNFPDNLEVAKLSNSIILKISYNNLVT